MHSGVDFTEIQRMAPAFSRAVGKSREEAKRLLLIFAGVERLRDLDERSAHEVECYMRSVIKLHEKGGRWRSTESI